MELFGEFNSCLAEAIGFCPNLVKVHIYVCLFLKMLIQFYGKL